MSLKNIASNTNKNCGKITILNDKINNLQTLGSIANVLFVSANGSTKFKTINSAITHILKKNPSNLNRFVIYVGPGVYTENIIIPSFVNVIGSGDGSILTPANRNNPVVIIQNFSTFSKFRIII